MEKICEHASPNFFINRQEDAKCGVLIGWFSKEDVPCTHPCADIKDSKTDKNMIVLCDTKNAPKSCIYFSNKQ